MDTVENFNVRFFHAMPNIGEIEISVNGKFITGLNYRGFSEYYPAKTGTYNIAIYLKTNKKNPILTEKISFDKDIYTFAIVGLKDIISYNLITSGGVKPDLNKAIIRFANLVPPDSGYDVFINNKKAIADLKYEDLTNFLSLSPNKYDFKATSTTTGTVKLQDPSMQLKKGKIYTGYMVGMDEGTPELQILLPLEGATYITL